MIHTMEDFIQLHFQKPQKEHSVDFSGKGGTPLPCLETFHGDEAFSEQVCH